MTTSHKERLKWWLAHRRKTWQGIHRAEEHGLQSLRSWRAALPICWEQIRAHVRAIRAERSRQ